jgi:hypothetical protein
MAVMVGTIDIMELARQIAKIASSTTDPETGHQLMEILEMLMRSAGLPLGSS